MSAVRMIEIEWGCKSSFLEFVFFLALNFNVAKLKNCQILLFFVRPSAIKNKPPKKKQLDIKLDNSTSSFIPKIYGKNKREKECFDWKTIHNYFISFS